MSNRDKYFKGQQENEEFICFMRHHWMVLIKEFLYLTLFIVVVYFVVSNIETIQSMLRGNRQLKLFFATAFLIGTMFIHRFFMKMFNYFINVGIITDMRFIDHQKTLFFRDTIDSIDMAQIQNIERLKEGVMASIFGYGDIKIFLTASSGIKTFYYVPNVKFHFRCISRQKEARQRHLLREQGYIAPRQRQRISFGQVAIPVEKT